MEPKPIPAKLTQQGTGMPLKFKGPEGSDIGDLEILNLTHPDQMRAILLGQEPPHPPGSMDYWISWWQPSEIELEKLKKGAPVRLTFIGATHINPMMLDVGYDLEDLQHDTGGN